MPLKGGKRKFELLPGPSGPGVSGINYEISYVDYQPANFDEVKSDISRAIVALYETLLDAKQGHPGLVIQVRAFIPKQTEEKGSSRKAIVSQVRLGKGYTTLRDDGRLGKLNFGSEWWDWEDGE